MRPVDCRTAYLWPPGNPAPSLSGQLGGYRDGIYYRRSDGKAGQM